MMADGRLSKCKECTRADVTENRNANIDYYRNYDRKRYDDAGRRGSPSPSAVSRGRAKWYSTHKAEKKAHTILKRAIDRGDLVRPSVCSKCGELGKIEGHHEDYSRPLEVEWLCSWCHGKTWRKERKELQPKKRGGYKGSMLPTRAVLP